MARKSYGNTIKYEKRTGYVQGNTVRKLQVAEPYSNDPTSIEQLEEERKRIFAYDDRNGNSKERYDVPIR